MALPVDSVEINLETRSYNIDICPNLLDEAGKYISNIPDVTQVGVITDSNVEGFYGARFTESLLAHQVEHHYFVIPDGEGSKSVAMASNIWDKFVEYRLDRKSLVVALGGGVVGDLAGFVAATYLRGVRFLQIPTTLLAQVDSSVGGKTGINLLSGKNMVGVFHQPVGVIIDPATLLTLDPYQYASGLGEVLKYGVSLDYEFFTFLEERAEEIKERNLEILQKVIAHCCRIKARIVELDEFETTGARVILNYGHTFGHAMETAAGYGKIMHGTAVSIGSIYAAKLANRLRKRGNDLFRNITEEWIERQIALHQRLQMPTSMKEMPELVTTTPEELIAIMERDKKTERKQRCFVLPTAIGKSVQMRNVDLDLVLEVLAD